MVKISVIVPVHNVEMYLEECLESIVNQTFTDIEVICINDGSTDGSLDILNEYQKRDSRIRIISQENRGAGASRNIALEHACGEYVYFMDSDDYLELTAFEELNAHYLDKSPDFIMFKVNNFYEDADTPIDFDYDYYSMPYLKKRVGNDCFDYSDVSKFAMELCVCPPGNLFNREFLTDIRFPEDLLFEDNVFFTHALFKADKIYFYDEFLYNRRRRADSTTAPISIRSFDTIEISNQLIDLCYQFNHEKHIPLLYYRIFHNMHKLLKNADPEDKEIFFERIKSEYIKNSERWENDYYFANKMNPRYRHIYRCALKSKNAEKFEKCVEKYSSKGKLNKLRNRLHEII